MALSNRDILHKYLRRQTKFPHIWCPGCGNGVVLGALLRAIDDTGWAKDDIALVSGIGCAGRATVYVDFNTLHTAHGRALTFAAGLKAVRPSLKVIALMGDGDAVGIGGNHFIHACRRNIDLTAVVVNNYTYGMTGGQESPTTPQGSRTATSVEGALEPPFDIMELALGAGAGFAARTTSFHVRDMENFIRRGLAHEGFSVVEVVSACPTQYGRRNPPADPVEMMKRQRDASVSREDAATLPEEQLRGRIVTGVFAERQRAEWARSYEELRRDLAARERGR
jgi:2-oxoglutarate ferredoxin oxidoreductase subunit beta